MPRALVIDDDRNVIGLRARNGTEYPLAAQPGRWILGSGPKTAGSGRERYQGQRLG